MWRKKERTSERTNEISCSFCPSHNVVKSFHLCQVNYFSSIKKKELIRKMKSIFTREKKRLLINLLWIIHLFTEKKSHMYIPPFSEGRTTFIHLSVSFFRFHWRSKYDDDLSFPSSSSMFNFYSGVFFCLSPPLLSLFAPPPFLYLDHAKRTQRAVQKKQDFYK